MIKAKLLLTDPPYGIDIVKVEGGKIGGNKPFGKSTGQVHGKIGGKMLVDAKQYRPIIGDNTTETAEKNYQVAKEYTENQIIFGGNYFTDF